MHGTCLCPSVDLTFVCHSEESRRWRDDEESPGSEGLGEILRGACPACPGRSLGEPVEGLRMTLSRFRTETSWK
jgi:hypothetical protein